MISTLELLAMPVRLVLFGVSPRRVCLALAAAVGLTGLGLAVGFAAATCGPDCDHP